MRRRSFPSEIAIQTKIISGRKLGNIKLRYIVHTYVTSIWKTITISRSPNGTMVQGKDLKNTEECLLYRNVRIWRSTFRSFNMIYTHFWTSMLIQQVNKFQIDSIFDRYLFHAYAHLVFNWNISYWDYVREFISNKFATRYW